MVLLKMFATSSEYLSLSEAFQETFIPRVRPATGTLVSKFFCLFWKLALKLFQETIRASSRQGRSVKAQEADCSMSHNKTSWRRSPCWRPLKAGRAGGAKYIDVPVSLLK